MARYGRSFRRPPRSRRYPAGGGYGRGFGRPRRRHGHGYGTSYGGPQGEYGYEYGGRGPVRSGAEWPDSPRREYGYPGRGYGPNRESGRRGREGTWRPAGPERGFRGARGRPAPMSPEGARSYGRYEEPRYGYTPSSRWPEDGHDVDHLTARDRAISDDDVRNVVHENLSRDHWLDTHGIDVEVDHGVVTLTGDVNDYMEARYAWDDAWESQGVRGVINNLTVRTDRPSSEMDLPQTSG